MKWALLTTGITLLVREMVKPRYKVETFDITNINAHTNKPASYVKCSESSITLYDTTGKPRVYHGSCHTSLIPADGEPFCYAVVCTNRAGKDEVYIYIPKGEGK